MAAGDPEYVEGNVIVTYKPSLSLKEANDNLGKHSLAFKNYFPVVSDHRQRHTGLVRQEGRKTADLIAEMSKDPAVESVEPDYIRRVNTTPNDTYFSNLWALKNTGQSVNGTTGTSGADMSFLTAWQNAPTSNTQVIVGIIDTGLDYSHTDLAANVWTNPNAGHDASGLTGDLHGYDFADGWGDNSDSGYHGTHVAGIAAACGYNSLGVIGANPQAKVMSLKVSTDGSSMSSSAIISALGYATTMKNNGVNIVALNASYGGGGYSSSESSAIQAAGNAGIIFCAAAGNGDSHGVAVNNDTTSTYPASYRLSNMIVVAATDQNDQLPSWSNYGATTVDLAAPGVNILSTVPLAGNGLGTPDFPSVTSSLQVGSTGYTTYPLTYSGATPSTITDTAYSCGIGNPSDFSAAVRGHIALIQRGTLTFAAKAANAAAAGARAVIIYDNITESSALTWTLGSASNGTSTPWLPVVGISLTDGTNINSQAPVSITLAVNDSYAYLDGTSMATPQVTAAVSFAAMIYPNESVTQRVHRVLAAVDSVSALQGKVATGGRLNLQKILNSNSSLSSLAISTGTLSPTFTSTSTSYTASVPNSTSSITVTPTLTDTTATVKVNGTTVASGTASGAISLSVGTNVITTLVTAQNGTTTTTYTITVTRGAASTVATLSGLVLSSGTLSPTFAAATTSYSASVTNATTSITVRPTVTDSTATIKVNGTAVASGVASGAISLNVGTNTITTLVTAQDGTTTKTYVVTVTRAPSTVATLSGLGLSSGTLSPVFAAATTSYTASVTNATTSITVRPTGTDSSATIKVNGTTVVSGTTSGTISLSVGTNTITTVVTAQDGVTTMTYIVTVTRISNVATLSGLTLSSGSLTPTFAAATTSYTASVTNATTSITVRPTVTDSTATIKVNGTTVTSGVASGAFSLSVGTNTITTVVTAQDGITTTTYIVTVTRISNVATLSSLTLSSGSLTPTFATATTSYTETVTNSTTSINVTPTATDATATIKVNGTTVQSGTVSGAISLSVGTNTITTVVTAQDGTTTKTYTETVTRAPSSISTLSALVLSNGTLSPSFSPSTLSYTSNASSTTTSVMVTPTVTDPTSTVKVNGTTVASGSQSAAISLGPSSINTITVLVTAQDGINTSTYSVAVDNTPYGIWKKSKFSNLSEWIDPTVSGDMATPAHDGISNLMKYALGLSPMTPGTASLPTASIQNGYLTLTYRMNKSSTDVTFTVQSSNTLGGTWSTASNVILQTDPTPGGGSYWLVTVRDTTLYTGSPARFMRLQVTR